MGAKSMAKDKAKIIQQKLAKMTLEQKVGQCLVIGYVGNVITPEIIRRIKNYYPSGIRVGLTFRIKTAIHDPYATSEKFAHRVIRAPKGTVKDFVPGFPAARVTNGEYCEFLNTLKQAALYNELGLPLHITFDQEGDASADYFMGGVKYFPNCAGQARSGDRGLARKVAWATGRQMGAIGFNWIHSPVLDVNTNPLSPAIGIRSYGETAEEVIENARQAFKGFKEAKMISTGKHFPGHGPTTQDSHKGLPCIDESAEVMRRVHLAPFQALIDAGIPSIMSAHTSYPALDGSGRSASLSKAILTDLLRGEMGFEGVVTTDDISMGGIVQDFEVSDACIEAINAGNDLVLIRDESPLIDEVFEKLVRAAQSGRLPEERLDEAITRILSVKYDYGLFEKGNLRNPKRADEGVRDAKVAKIAVESANKAITVVRDEQKLLPLPKDRNVLLIEQQNPLHVRVNDHTLHPGILWECMLKHSEKVGIVETTLGFNEDDKQRARKRLDEAEVVVVTNYFYRREGGGNAFIKEIVGTGKPVVVLTNTPYPQVVLPEYKTVVCTYGASRESMEAAANVLFGEKSRK